MLNIWFVVVMAVVPVLPSGTIYQTQSWRIGPLYSEQECLRVTDAINHTSSGLTASCQPWS